MTLFRLQKPNAPARIDKAILKITSDEDISAFIERTHRPEYLYWNKVRYLPRPNELTAEEFWAMVKFLRINSPGKNRTVIRDENGRNFTWLFSSDLGYFLSEIDSRAGGIIDPALLESQNARRTFMARGIIEEAIASSQLEGASTTRKVAREMIQKNRKPINKSEQMILNNYQAMLHIEDRLRYEDLNLESLLNLHITLTQGTVEIKETGRFRRDIDQVVVSDSSNNVIYHIPPSEKFLKREIKKLIIFANDDDKKSPSVHPVIKAILLHFWIGYLHPFTDGNGRLARAIFYWYLLKKQYWGFSYLPLSRVIKRSPAQYRDAYVFSEQDDNDLTYFIDYNIRKIAQAKREFETYVKRKQSEYLKVSKSARMKYRLNERQIQLLRSLRKEPDATTTIKTHSIFNGISRVTAGKDLEELEQKGFLVSQKLGKERPFSATEKADELFS